jgi:hypothetical protein
MDIPSREEFRKGCEEFEKHEKRDAMYKVATFLVSHFWGKPSDMANGLGVLLLTWNQPFYRYGIFNFDKLEKAITDNFQKIKSFRNRDIFSLSNSDEDDIKDLFAIFLEALQIDASRRQGQGSKSPVAVAKALHLLAPNFFPLWDNKIARAYGCYYNKNSAEKYVSFCWKMKEMAEKIQDCLPNPDDRSILKRIDEYNYSKYTKEWI